MSIIYLLLNHGHLSSKDTRVFINGRPRFLGQKPIDVEEVSENSSSNPVFKGECWERMKAAASKPEFECWERMKAAASKPE
ncbi:hypothetical protein AMTR_s00069p00143740 [Amborella trichopoda]|uniref:Uncharacterized protein n=1 Tax=Amborella trichopoda TaxID=13333 RepID=U5DD86_AMBTC|nr:hypothetical protein AMTR_s00069p00143740 [Amborella trichopoda]